MLDRLSKTCDSSHVHQKLVGPRAAKAAVYPTPLIEAMLRGIRDTADAEHREDLGIEDALLVQSVERAGQLHDVPPGVEARALEQDLDSDLDGATVDFHVRGGKCVQLPVQWKAAYKDAYTQDTLPHNNIRAAMIDEMRYVCAKVVEGVHWDDVVKDPERVIVGGRWVTHNKGDVDHPCCRGRYVAQEINTNGDADPSFYAATPPLEAKRILMSRWASEKKRASKHLKLHV